MPTVITTRVAGTDEIVRKDVIRSPHPSHDTSSIESKREAYLALSPWRPDDDYADSTVLPIRLRDQGCFSRLTGRALTSDEALDILRKIAELQIESQRQYDEHHRRTTEWCEAVSNYAMSGLGAEPQRRPVKRGRKITAAEGRAMALDCGFNPAVHGMYRADAEDAALADAAYAHARAAWQNQFNEEFARYESEHTRPAKPAIPSWHCSTPWLVAKEAGLL